VERWKPAINKKWLYWLSGLIWFGVGVGLCLRAVFWIKAYQSPVLWGLFLLSLAGALFIGHYLLAKIARRNLKRLDQKPSKICVFAFQPLRSYLIILLMVAMGVGLRRSDLPRVWLAVVYSLMGGALIVASRLYFLRALEVCKE